LPPAWPLELAVEPRKPAKNNGDPEPRHKKSALYFLCAHIKLLGHEPWGFQLDFDAIAVGDGALLLKNARSCAEALVASF